VPSRAANSEELTSDFKSSVPNSPETPKKLGGTADAKDWIHPKHERPICAASYEGCGFARGPILPAQTGRSDGISRLGKRSELVTNRSRQTGKDDMEFVTQV
jgi:hypothetical protein